MTAGLEPRFDALRQAAALPGAELRPILEAALAELDAAITALRDQAAPGRGADGDVAAAANAESRLLGTVFRQVPVPLFLLASDATVRRVNAAAGGLLGSAPGYATGKPFTAFVDAPQRAAVRSQLAAVARTGKGRQARCDLVGTAGKLSCQLMLRRIRPRGEAAQLLVAVSQFARGTRPAGLAAGRTAPPAARLPRASGAEVAAMTRRLDLATAAARVMLESVTSGAPVMLERCAQLLAGELAAWVIVDMERQQRLRRQFVVGPDEQQFAGLATEVTGVDPAPDSAPGQAHLSGRSVLVTHPEDDRLLGADPDGVPLLLRFGAGSVLCVPISDGERSYGALTLARRAGEGTFRMPEAGLVSEIGEQLGRAVRVDRAFRRRSEAADALQAILLPRGLLHIPGVDMAAAHLAGTTSQVGGDFYDAYRAAGGWGIAMGDVCGKGEYAAAMTSMARHAIRMAAHWNSDPCRVLSMTNEIMLAEDLGGSFVTADVAHLQWRGGVLHITVGSAGHPAPILITADGKPQALRGGGLPLGIFPDAEPACTGLDLARGDLLFFFTDGLAGARSAQGAYFESHLAGELTARARMPPADLIDGMRTAVLNFSGGEFRDDLTMLALRRTGEPPPES